MVTLTNHAINHAECFHIDLNCKFKIIKRFRFIRLMAFAMSRQQMQLTEVPFHSRTKSDGIFQTRSISAATHDIGHISVPRNFLINLHQP